MQLVFESYYFHSQDMGTVYFFSSYSRIEFADDLFMNMLSCLLNPHKNEKTNSVTKLNNRG